MYNEKSSFGFIKLILGIVISIIVLLLFLKDPLHKFELITFDYRVKSLPPSPTHPDIVLIEMAEDSIKSIGRWPWPREWHATLITALSQYKAKAIVFDILFSETGTGLGDTSLETAMEKAGNVYLPFAFEFKSKKEKEKAARSIILPIERFSKQAKGKGHINISPDIDGTIRKSPLLIDYKGRRYPQLAFKIASDALGVKDKDITIKKGKYINIDKSSIGPITVPVDSENQMIVKWAGKWKDTFKHYSYVDIVASYENLLSGKKPRIDLKNLKGKICLIGLTAVGLHDVRANPIEPLYPALGVNANIINNILTKNFIKQVPKTTDIIIILVIGILVSLVVSRFRPARGMLATFLILAGYIFIAFALFRHFGIWINIIYPVLLTVTSYLIVTLYSQISMAIERSRLFTLATRDSVTGLYVIRHFNLLLEAEMGITGKRQRRRFSLIMGDIDFFKKVNDSYGHQGGDVVLKGVSKVIKSNLRELDIACRYGGEEFIMMLPGARLDEAKAVAERMRKGVENYHFKYGDQILRVTISFGVTELQDEQTKDELIKKVDDSLYEAKRTGRNRVCVWKG